MRDAHAFDRTSRSYRVAAVTTVLFQRLGQPVVFGYLLAGMIVEESWRRCLTSGVDPDLS